MKELTIQDIDTILHHDENRLSNPKKFSWEKTTCPDVDVNGISAKTLDDIILSGINKGRIPREASRLKNRLAKLDHLGLRTADGLLTNGAVVLCGKTPNREFTQCKVRLARFEGTDMDKFRDQTVCYGNLFEQYDAIIEFCQKHMFLAGNMDQIERIDTLTVPIKAIREATLNLLVHRTWWSGARTPSVAIFDDRIEFMNPGSFPPGSTAEDFRKRPHSEPINEVISSVFFKSGLMEAWGRGIPNFVCLTIRFKNPLTPYLTGDGRNEGVNEGVSEGVNEILSGLGQAVRATYALIKQYPGLNAPQLASKCGKGDSTIERHVAILRKNDLIEHRGADKTGGYYIKEIQNNND